jgi:hypothetical protein
METEEKLFIYNKIEDAINEIYNHIKLTCDQVEKGMFVIKEINKPKKEVDYVEYTIELVSRANLNTDDYGVVYSLMIEDGGKNILIISNITRSFGELLYSKEYILESKQSVNILKDIKCIPVKLFDYIKR